MKKLLLIPFILFGYIHLTKSQSFMENQKPRDKFIIKLNYSNVNSKQIVPVFANQAVTLQETLFDKNSYYGIEGLYKFNRLWSAGAYFGYSNGTYISNEILESDSPNYSFAMDSFGKSYFYGLKGELQLLPLLFKLEGLRLKVYCPIQAGLVSERITTFENNTNSWEKPAFEIGAGIGVGYNFTKNIGIFGEYQFGHFYNQRNSQWKVGLFLSF